MRFLPKALLLAGAAGLTCSSLLAHAEDTPPAPGPGPQPGTPAEPAPTPEHSFTGKAALYSEYEYRGIAQSSQNAAVQLNLDYAHSSGFYLGTFLSNIKWLEDTAAANGFSSNARVEWDIYGGYRHEIFKDTTLDVGYLRYEYPSSSSFNPKPNTDEVYAGVTWQWLNIKYSYSFNNTFGVQNSKGSDYIEGNVAYPWPGFEKLTLTGTLGHQRYKGTQDSGFDNNKLSYTVWKAGASYDFGHNINAGAYYKGTDAESALYTVNGKDWSKDRLVAFVTYSF